jgi:Trypsin
MQSVGIRRSRAFIVAIGLAVAALAYANAQGSVAGGATAPAGQRAAPARSSQASEVEATIGRTDVVEKLEAEMGSAFGGVWFEPATAQLYVGVTSPASRQAAEAVSAQVGLSADVTEVPVRSTRAELVAEQQRLSPRLAGLFAQEEVSTSIAPDNNAVEVELGSAVPAAEREALEREAADADVKVSIDVVPSSQLGGVSRLKQCKKHVKNEAYCDPTIVAGVSLESAGGERCTVGPAARLVDKSTTANTTKTYVLTAGHCINSAKGGGVGAKWSSWNKNGEKKEIGPAIEFLFPETDVGVIEVNNPGAWVVEGLTPVTPKVAMWSKTEESEPTEVTAQQKPVKGVETCYSGQTSGTNCGKILNESVEEVIQGELTKNLVEVELGTGEGGDSGSPFFKKSAPSEVEGTLVAGSATRTYFHSLETSFSKLATKLKLLTSANKGRHD